MLNGESVGAARSPRSLSCVTAEIMVKEGGASVAGRAGGEATSIMTGGADKNPCVTIVMKVAPAALLV